MRVVVIGYGHAANGEDAAGLLVAAAVKKAALPGVEIRAVTGEAMRVVEAWECSQTAIVVEAVDTGRMPGTIFRLEGPRSVANALAFLTSPYSLGLLEAFERGALTGRLPSRVVFYGIEAHQCGPGQDIGPDVLKAIDTVAARIVDDVRGLLRPAVTPP